MTENDFWTAGNSITNHNIEGSERVGIRIYLEFFGATPEVCSIMWDLLTVADVHPDLARPKHMLCALHFLRRYSTESINAAIFGMDEKTFRKWSRTYVELLSTLPVVSAPRIIVVSYIFTWFCTLLFLYTHILFLLH